MYGVEAFRFGLRQMQHPHGTNSESRVLDALDDATRVPRLHSVGLDDRERSFRHILTIISKVDAMKGQQGAAPDQHEGAVEGDRPSDLPQHGNPNAPALDDQGLPPDTDL